MLHFSSGKLAVSILAVGHVIFRALYLSCACRFMTVKVLTFSNIVQIVAGQLDILCTEIYYHTKYLAILGDKNDEKTVFFRTCFAGLYCFAG